LKKWTRLVPGWRSCILENLWCSLVSPCCYYKVVASVLFILDQGNKDDEYPAEFKVLVDKQFLFKVEVSEGNVHKKYRNYAVKKATDDADAIAHLQI